MFVSINLILFVWVLTIFSACPCPVYLSVGILTGISTHLKLCFSDAIHNFKWVNIIVEHYNRQNGGQQFWNLVDVSFGTRRLALSPSRLTAQFDLAVSNIRTRKYYIVGYDATGWSQHSSLYQALS